MAIKVSKINKAAIASVDVEYKDSGNVVNSVSTAEEVPIPGADKEVVRDCSVGYSAKYTHNLGNYQSVSYQVSLNVACSYLDIDKTYDASKDWVDTKLNSLIAEVTGD